MEEQKVLWPSSGNNEMFKGLSHDDKIDYLENKLNYDRDMINDLTDDDLIDIYDNDYRNDDKAILIDYVDKMCNQCVTDVFYLDVVPPIKTDNLVDMLINDNGTLKLNENDEVIVDCAAGNDIRVIGIQDLDTLEKIEEASSLDEEMQIAFENGSPIILHETITEAKLNEVTETDPEDLSSELETINRLYDDYGFEYFTAMPLADFDNDTESIEYNYPKFFKVVKAFFKETGKLDKDNINDTDMLEETWYNINDVDFKTILEVCNNLVSNDGESQNITDVYDEVKEEEPAELEEALNGKQPLKDLLHSKTDKEELSEAIIGPRGWEALDELTEMLGPDAVLENLIKYLDVDTVTAFINDMQKDYDITHEEELDESDDNMLKEQLEQDLDTKKQDHVKFYRYNAGLSDDDTITEVLDKFAIGRVCSKYNISEDQLKEELLGENR